MREIDPILLDRELQHAAQIATTWLRSLKEDAIEPHQPLQRFRLLLGKARFDEISELPEHDPLRNPLRRCIARYAELRINQNWLREAAVQRYCTQHMLTEPLRERRTVNEMLKAALTGGPLMAGWLQALLRSGGPSTETQVNLWQRRVEIADRLGLSSMDDLELPLDGAALCAHAQSWLSQTQSMADEFRRDTLTEWLPLALGQDATEGWPAELNERNVARWFRHSRLLEELPIDTPPMPETLGASSYVRALAILGFAIREAGSSTRQPFCVARDPYSLESHGLAMCFARLLASPPFIQRNLELSSANSIDHRRCIGRVLLFESRILAAKVLLRSAARQGERALREAYPALLHQVLGVAVPDIALGVLFTPRLGDPARFCGMFLGESQFERLTETHDEDWFRNPRAVDELRSNLLLPPETATTQSKLGDGAKLLEQRLSGWL